MGAVQVTMVLAQGPSRPGGDLDDRMVLHVILTGGAQLDAAEWSAGHQPWRTRRERSGHPVRSGELVKIDEGWALRELDSEDEPLYSLVAGTVRPGETMSVARLDGGAMLYRIVAVDPD